MSNEYSPEAHNKYTYEYNCLSMAKNTDNLISDDYSRFRFLRGFFRLFAEPLTFCAYGLLAIVGIPFIYTSFDALNTATLIISSEVALFTTYGIIGLIQERKRSKNFKQVFAQTTRHIKATYPYLVPLIDRTRNAKTPEEHNVFKQVLNDELEQLSAAAYKRRFEEDAKRLRAERDMELEKTKPIRDEAEALISRKVDLPSLTADHTAFINNPEAHLLPCRPARRLPFSGQPEPPSTVASTHP